MQNLLNLLCKSLFWGIVNVELVFIDVFSGWLGSSHDARIFRRRTISKKKIILIIFPLIVTFWVMEYILYQKIV